MNITTAKKRWDRLTVEQRKKLLCTDPSMAHPSNASLLERWSKTEWANMAPLMKDATVELITDADAAEKGGKA